MSLEDQLAPKIKMKRTYLPLLILATLSGLQACADPGLGVELAAIALAAPFAQPTGNPCVDNPFEAYASRSDRCDMTVSPIRSTNVNSQKGGNAFCALEWGLAYDRMDMVKEAIAKGADPFRCERNAWGLFLVLEQVKSKYGDDRLQTYLEVFKTSNLIRSQFRQSFVGTGIALQRPYLVRFGVELGHPVNNPLYTDKPKDNFEYEHRNRTPLCMAAVLFLALPKSQGATDVIVTLKDLGARADSCIDSYILQNRSTLRPDAMTSLQDLLKRSSGSERD